MDFSGDDRDCTKCKGRFPKFMFIGRVCRNCINAYNKRSSRLKSKPFKPLLDARGMPDFSHGSSRSRLAKSKKE